MRVSKRQEAPASLESLHRKIMGAAHTVEREVVQFQHSYLTQTEAPENLDDFIREICESVEKDAADLQDFSDLEFFVESNKNNERNSGINKSGKTNKNKPSKDKIESVQEDQEDDFVEAKVLFGETIEYEQLQKIFNRAKAFDYVAFSLKNQIADAFGKLQTYCLSFSPETKGETCRTVQEYENKIIDWKHNLQIKLDGVDEILDEHDKCKNKSFSYISDYNSVLNWMKDTCRTLISMCDPIKKWVTSDSTYARRVQEEITQCNRQKMESKDALLHIDDNREKLSLTIKRKAFQLATLETDLERTREEKRNIRRREADTQENLAKHRADAKRKRRDLEESKSRLSTRKENSPTAFNYLTSMVESLKQDSRALEGRCSMMHRSILALQKDQDSVQGDIHAIEKQVRECRMAHDQLYQKLEKVSYNHWKMSESLSKLENRIQALKRIREIKLHTNTVKKIFHFGYHAGHMQDRDELQDAIRIASEEVGKDWPYLYQKLPFLPPRPFDKRSHDIEVIDMSSRRVQSGGFRTVTQKSLEKWRRLNHAASLPDLVKGLKRLRKTDAVRRIQKEIMVSSPISKTRPRPYGYRKTAKSSVTV